MLCGVTPSLGTLIHRKLSRNTKATSFGVLEELKWNENCSQIRHATIARFQIFRSRAIDDQNRQDYFAAREVGKTLRALGGCRFMLNSFLRLCSQHQETADWFAFRDVFRQSREDIDASFQAKVIKKGLRCVQINHAYLHKVFDPVARLKDVVKPS